MTDRDRLLRPLVLTVAVLTLIVGLAPARGAITGKPPAREYGTGLVRFKGHGPEWYWNENHRLRHRLERKWAPTVDYAYRLAATVYGVPYGELRSVGWCESRGNPWAVNGRYRGLFQEGPMFERGPFARFGVFDRVANSLTAAYTVRHDGSWRQWECRP